MDRSTTRPRLLNRAARAGAALYSRDRDLSRLLPRFFGRRTQAAILAAIRAAEAECETDRRAAAPGYSLRRHVSLLSALLAESRPDAA